MLIYTNTRIIVFWLFQRILHHGYHSIFVHKHLKMCYIIGQFPMYTTTRWGIET